MYDSLSSRGFSHCFQLLVFGCLPRLPDPEIYGDDEVDKRKVMGWCGWERVDSERIGLSFAYGLLCVIKKRVRKGNGSGIRESNEIKGDKDMG